MRPLGSVACVAVGHGLEAEDMPQFMDFHRAGTADAFGVRQVELYRNSDGTVYCLLDAPHAQAVRDHHAALGVDCGEVHEVTGIR